MHKAITQKLLFHHFQILMARCSHLFNLVRVGKGVIYFGKSLEIPIIVNCSQMPYLLLQQEIFIHYVLIINLGLRQMSSKVFLIL